MPITLSLKADALNAIQDILSIKIISVLLQQDLIPIASKTSIALNGRAKLAENALMGSSLITQASASKPTPSVGRLLHLEIAHHAILDFYWLLESALIPEAHRYLFHSAKTMIRPAAVSDALIATMLMMGNAGMFPSSAEIMICRMEAASLATLPSSTFSAVNAFN